MTDYIDEFEEVVTSIFGVYLMSMQGFNYLVNDLKNRQDKDILEMKNSRPELASIQYFDSRPYAFGKLTKGSLKKPEGIDLLY